MKEKKVGLLGLIALVIGSVIGGGIFNVSKEIAETTSIGAPLIGWLISGIGVFFIVKVFQTLITEVPEINDGIYKYAKLGFGNLAGFSSAWGYWLSCVVSNASYPILIVQTLSYFFLSLNFMGSNRNRGRSCRIWKGKNKNQVGTATMTGYIAALALYLCIVIFSYGIIPAEKLSQLKDPALAYIIEEVAGPWGATFINVSVLISIFGAWLSWTLIAAEIPYNFAEDGLFPKFLSKLNTKGAASGALIFNGLIKQISFFVSLFVSNAYLFVTNSAAALMLLPYIFSSLFLIKISYSSKKIKNVFLGLAAATHGMWMIFSAGSHYLFQTIIIYIIGPVIYVSYKNKYSQR